MRNFEEHYLKNRIDVWIRLVAEKQQQVITAYNNADVAYWSHELGELVELKNMLARGAARLLINTTGSPSVIDVIEMMKDGIETKLTSKYIQQRHCTHVGIDPAKEGADKTVYFNHPDGNMFLDSQPDEEFNKRKLRDAIVKTINLSEGAATRLITGNKGHSVKELVYMALQLRGQQLCSARDRDQDSTWYANHHISTTLNAVEEMMMHQGD